MMLEPFLALRVQAPAAAAEHPSKEQTDALASQRTLSNPPFVSACAGARHSRGALVPEGADRCIV